MRAISGQLTQLTVEERRFLARLGYNQNGWAMFGSFTALSAEERAVFLQLSPRDSNLIFTSVAEWVPSDLEKFARLWKSLPPEKTQTFLHQLNEEEREAVLTWMDTTTEREKFFSNPLPEWKKYLQPYIEHKIMPMLLNKEE